MSTLPNLQKHPRIIWKKYTDEAKGQPCTMNSPWCTYNDEQTCFRHLNESFAGKGKGLKADDFAGFDGCQGCEDWYNSDIHSLDLDDENERDWYAFRAMVRTLRNRVERGILKI